MKQKKLFPLKTRWLRPPLIEKHAYSALSHLLLFSFSYVFPAYPTQPQAKPSLTMDITFPKQTDSSKNMPKTTRSYPKQKTNKKTKSSYFSRCLSSLQSHWDGIHLVHFEVGAQGDLRALRGTVQQSVLQGLGVLEVEVFLLGRRENEARDETKKKRLGVSAKEKEEWRVRNFWVWYFKTSKKV